MKKNTYYKAAGCLSLAMAAVMPASAQNTTTASVERQKLENIWVNNTDNAAAGVIDAPSRYSLSDLNFGMTKGDFKRVQQGKDNNSVGFHTEGGGIYEKMGGMYLWGEFSYSRDRIKGARFNASLIDPLRGMPFLLADSTASKWINQDYSMRMKVAFPKFFDCLTLGVGASYQNAQGAKQVDPRPLMRLSKIGVTPSAVVEIGKHNFLGAHFDYYNRREDGNPINTNNRVNQAGWDFVAPGFFQTGEFGSFSSLSSKRFYNANAMGGGVQYGFKNDRLNLLVSGSYMQKVEDVDNQYSGEPTASIRKMIGTVKEELWNGKLVANYTFNSGNILALNIGYTDKSIDGIEYLQTYDNSFDVQAWIINAKFTRSNFSTKQTDVKLDYMVTDDGNSYKWWMGAQYTKLTDGYVYYQPRSTQDVETAVLGAFVSRNIRLCDRHALTLTVNGGYSTNRSGELDYHGYKADNVGFTMLTLKDFEFLCTDYAKFGGEVTYTFSGFKNPSMSLYVTADFDYYKPDSEIFSKRTFTNFKVGVAF